ncbi:MAG: hypothetical protein ABWX57_10140 [Aeromicrobium sp.]
MTVRRGHRGTRGRRLLPALLVVVGVVVGCGGAAGPSRPSAAEPSSAPTSATAPELRDDLAEAAEEEASGAPRGPRPPRPVFGGPVLGGDLGWPQCPRGMGIPERRTLGAPMPLKEARYVVVGLTNGPGFSANPCLADQVDWARRHRLLTAAYAVASHPDAGTVARYGTDGPFDASTRLGALANTGYQQARFNVASMVDAGLRSPIVWIDVEPVPDFEWSADPVANAAVVRGAARGYVDAGYRIGVYSTPHLWAQIVDDLALGVPEWRAAGETSRAEAARRCGQEWAIQGGDPVLAQWLENARDHNVTCPGVHRQLTRWFHSYGP